MGLRIKGAYLVYAALSSVARDAATGDTPTELLLQASRRGRLWVRPIMHDARALAALCTPVDANVGTTYSCVPACIYVYDWLRQPRVCSWCLALYAMLRQRVFHAPLCVATTTACLRACIAGPAACVWCVQRLSSAFDAVLSRFFAGNVTELQRAYWRDVG